MAAMTLAVPPLSSDGGILLSGTVLPPSGLPAAGGPSPGSGAAVTNGSNGLFFEPRVVSAVIEAKGPEVQPAILMLSRALKMVRELPRGGLAGGGGSPLTGISSSGLAAPAVAGGGGIDGGGTLLLVPDLNRLLDVSRPEPSAAAVSRQLAAGTLSVAALAAAIVSPAHLAIVARLDEVWRCKVRDAVLSIVLRALTTAGQDPHPPAAMLTELVVLELVVFRGVCSTLETLLRGDPTTRRSAVAVLGKLAAVTATRGGPTSEAIRAAMTPLAALIPSLASDSALECDALSAARIMGWRQGTAALTQLGTLPAASLRRPIVSAAYIPSRDVLATCSSDGVIAIWGATPKEGKETAKAAADATGGGPEDHPSPPAANAPSVQLQLPQDYGAVAIDAAFKGHAFAVIGAPSSRTAAVKRPPALFIYAIDEHGNPTLAQTQPRPTASVITCIKGVPGRQAAFCSAESASTAAHGLVLYSANGTSIREIPSVHADYVTCLATSPDSDNTLFTGSRDHTAKLWDTRAPSPHVSLLSAHTDTVTSVAMMRDVVLTGSADRRLLLWDARKLSTPVAEKEFATPVLRVCFGPQASAIVATANVLAAVALHPQLDTQDMVPNVCYHALCPNYDGSLIFAAGEIGVVDVYCLRQASSR